MPVQDTWVGVWVQGMPIPEDPQAIFAWKEQATRWAEAEYPGLYEILPITFSTSIAIIEPKEHK